MKNWIKLSCWQYNPYIRKAASFPSASPTQSLFQNGCELDENEVFVLLFYYFFCTVLHILCVKKTSLKAKSEAKKNGNYFVKFVNWLTDMPVLFHGAQPFWNIKVYSSLLNHGKFLSNMNYAFFSNFTSHGSNVHNDTIFHNLQS